MPSGVYIRKPETRLNMSIAHTGIKFPKERCIKSGLARRGIKHKGGWHHSDETKEIIRAANIKRYDRIGRKKYKRCHHKCSEKKYQFWRTLVFERDNWTCQSCGKRGHYLEAHHIKSWSQFPKLRYEIKNGVTLCYGCHKLSRKKKL
jgi:5-methylcytosine-specific restriction endonuclease McrA